MRVSDSASHTSLPQTANGVAGEKDALKSHVSEGGGASVIGPTEQSQANKQDQRDRDRLRYCLVMW